MKIRFNPPRQHPSEDQGLTVSYAPAKRQAYRLRWYLILLLVASPLLYVLWSAGWMFWQQDAPGYVELPVYTLNSPQSGVIEQLQVSNGSQVKAGSVLLSIRNPERDTRIRLLQQQISQLQQTLPPAANPVPRATVDPAYVRYLQQSLADYQALFKAGAATRAELNEAMARLAAVREAPAPPAAPVLTPDTRGLQTELDALLAQQQGRVLMAPVAGQVSQLQHLPGMAVREGEPLLQLQQSERMQIIALLPERLASLANPGQMVEVYWPDQRRSRAVIRDNIRLSEAIPTTLSQFGDAQQGIVVRVELLDVPPAHYLVRQLRVKVVLPRQLHWPWQD